MASKLAIRQPAEKNKGGKWGLVARRRHHSSETFREQRSIRMATCFGPHSLHDRAKATGVWCNHFECKYLQLLVFTFQSLSRESPSGTHTSFFKLNIVLLHRRTILSLKNKPPYKAQHKETHKTHHTKKTGIHTTQTQLEKMSEL